MPKTKCPRCDRSLPRQPRRWYERLVLVEAAYHCRRCSRRCYRHRFLWFVL